MSDYVTLNDIFDDWKTNGIFQLLNTHAVPWKNTVSYTVLDYEYHGGKSGRKLISPLLEILIDDGEISAADKATIAELIFSKYKTNWTQLWATLSFDYNPIENYSMTELESANESGTGSDTGTGSVARTGTVAKSGTVAQTGTDTHEISRSESNTGSNTNSVYGFNSSSAVNADSQSGNSSTNVIAEDEETKNLTDTTNLTDTNNLLDTETRNFSRSDSKSLARTLTRKGNIGVTTSQQMIEAERQLWDWKFFEQVYKDIDEVLVSQVYYFTY